MKWFSLTSAALYFDKHPEKQICFDEKSPNIGERILYLRKGSGDKAVDEQIPGCYFVHLNVGNYDLSLCGIDKYIVLDDEVREAICKEIENIIK